MIARVIGQPSFHIRMLMRSVVVQNQVHVKIVSHGCVDVIEKRDELFVSMARQALADDRSIQNVERGKQRGGAVAPIVMCLPFGKSTLHRQDWRCPVKRLNLRFLVNAQNQRLPRRAHIKPNNITNFLGELRIGRELERRHAMRLQTMLVPNTRNRGTTNAELRSHRSNTPMRRVFGFRMERRFNDRIDGSLRNRRRSPRTLRIVEHRIHAALGETRTQRDDALARHSSLPCNLVIRAPFSSKQDHLGASNRSLLRASLTRNREQLIAPFWRQS